MEQKVISYSNGCDITNIHDKTLTIEIKSKDDVHIGDDVVVNKIICKGNSKVISNSVSNIYCYDMSQVKVLHSNVNVELHDWSKAKVLGNCNVTCYNNSNTTMLIGKATLYDYSTGVLLNKARAITNDNSMVYANDKTKVDAYGSSVVNKYDKARVYKHSELASVYICG